MRSSTSLAALAISSLCAPALAQKPSELSPRFAAERADLLANCAVPIRQLADLPPGTPLAEMTAQVEKGALSDSQVLTDDIKSVKFEIAKMEGLIAKSDNAPSQLGSRQIYRCLWQRRLAQLQGSPLIGGRLTKRSDWFAWATDTGCLFLLPSRYEKTRLRKSGSYRWEGAPCQRGKFVSGPGTLTIISDLKVTSNKPGKGRNLHKGAMAEGVWNGSVNDSDQYDGGSPPASDYGPTVYDMGCPEIQVTKGWCFPHVPGSVDPVVTP